MKTQIQTTITVELEKPSEKPVNQMINAFLQELIETTGEAHPEWEGQFEEVHYEYYCLGCDSVGDKDVCQPAVRCVRK